MSNPVRYPDDQARRPLRVVFFGMRCAFSVPPLQALIAAGFEIPAVVVPGPVDGWSPSSQARVLPMAGVSSSSTLDIIAAAARIPLLTLRGVRRPEQRSMIAALSPSAIAVACCPWRLPAEFRAIPPLGCLNVHPSLLPRWRGPEPLFWMFKQGDTTGGVTVHRMDDGLDTGPILAQRAVQVPDLVDGAAFEQELAGAGGTLLVDALHQVASGAATPAAQDEAQATMAPAPEEGDFTERSDRPAQLLANLVAGIAPLWGPVLVESHLTGESIPVRRVLHVDHGASSGDAVVRAGNAVTIRCAPGSVTFLAESRPNA